MKVVGNGLGMRLGTILYIRLLLLRGATALLVAALQPRYAVAVAQAKYGNLFQLTHTPRVTVLIYRVVDPT